MECAGGKTPEEPGSDYYCPRHCDGELEGHGQLVVGELFAVLVGRRRAADESSGHVGTDRADCQE